MDVNVDRKLAIEGFILKYFEVANSSTGATSHSQICENNLCSYEPFVPEDYDNCRQLLHSYLHSPLTEKMLRRITILIEGKFRQFLKHSATFLFDKLLETIHLWLKEDLNVSSTQVQLSIRIMLQNIQYFWNENNIKHFNIEDAEAVLFAIIKHNDSALENVMLAGTCLVRLLLAKHIYLERSEIHSVGSLVNLATNGNFGDITRLALLTGLLNCGNNAFFLSEVEGIPLLLFILPFVLELCEENVNQLFQSFQLLLLWLGAMKKNLGQLRIDGLSCHKKKSEQNLINVDSVKRIRKWWQRKYISKFGNEFCPNDYFFQGSSRVFNHIFITLSVNWENSVRGVPDLIRDCFNSLLELHTMESTLKCLKDDLIAKLVNYHLLMPWTTRGKYPPLTMLISHCKVKEILLGNSDISSNLTETLHSNPLSSAGVDLYRAMLKKYRDEESNVNNLIAMWEQTWLKPMLVLIENNDSLVQQNLFRHWFPCTLSIIPEIYPVLLDHFSKHEKRESFQIALITWMNQGRQVGIVTLDDMDLNIVHDCLFHLNDHIRMQAFALLCSSKRKAEPLSKNEIKLVEEFLLYNLNIDNAPFRQQFTTHMKSVLIRARDSCVNWLSEKNRINESKLHDSLKFVDNIFWLLIKNIHPCACYQRRQTSLDLLSVLLDTLIAPPDMSKRKGGVPVKAPLLIEYAKKSMLWNFNQPDVFYCLLSCLQDFMSEIKLSATRILQKYYSESVVLHDGTVTEKLLEQGFKWLNSPKTHVCESGSLLVNFIFKCPLMKQLGKTLLDCLEDLISTLKDQFLCAKSNLLLASKRSPMHGVILTLKTLINANEWNAMTIDCDKLENYVDTLINLIINIINFVLSVLSCKSSFQAPSFEDMGLAIDNILDAEGINLDEDNPTLSLEHQLILSCCWITLKESSFLLSAIVVKFPFKYPSTNGALTSRSIRHITDTLVKILTGCRHRGAIEACSIALGDLSRTLSSEQLPEYRDVPKSILTYLLEVIQTPDSNSSVTRRSAGLPLLFTAILSNELPQRKRALLDICVENLIIIARAPFTNTQNEMVDLPQNHAIHILRAIVHDSSLSQPILLHLVDLTKLCIDSFSSTSWAVRNASLQLFGSLVPRLLGQKKVRDENSQHNSVTADVLFHRYPHLKEYLLNYLRGWSCHSNPSEPGLVPILSLLSKLNLSSEGTNIEKDFSCLLDAFIGSPYFVIRKLAVIAFLATNNKAHAKILEETSQKLSLHLGQKGINYTHGLLLIIVQILERNDFHEDLYRDLDITLKKCYIIVTKELKDSYFVHALLLKILNKITARNSNSSLPPFEDIHLLEDCSWKPGWNEWLIQHTQTELKAASKKKLSTLLHNYLHENNQDRILSCLKFIKEELKNKLPAELNLFYQKNLIYLLCNNPHPYHVVDSLDLLLNLVKVSNLLSPEVSQSEFVNFMKCALGGSYGTLSTASAFVFVGYYLNEIIAQEQNFMKQSTMIDLLNIWCDQLRSQSDPKKAEDLRLKSAEVLYLVGTPLLEKLASFNDSPVVHWTLCLFSAGIFLLSDEVWEVRHKAAEFASQLPRPDGFYEFPKVQHNYGLEIFFNYFASKFGRYSEFWDALWDMICKPSVVEDLKFTLNEERQFILFEQDDVNIYAERYQLINISAFLLQTLLANNQNTEILKGWIQAKASLVLLNANEAASYLKIQELTNSELSSYILFGCSKSFILLHQLLTQTHILLNLMLLNEADKQNLEIAQSHLKVMFVTPWRVNGRD